MPGVLRQHSDIVLWKLLSIQVIFSWIYGRESGLSALFLHHLGTTAKSAFLKSIKPINACHSTFKKQIPSHDTIWVSRCSGYFLPNKPLTQSLIEPPEFQLYEWATLEVAHSRQLIVDLSKISSQRHTAPADPWPGFRVYRGSHSGYILETFEVRNKILILVTEEGGR